MQISDEKIVALLNANEGQDFTHLEAKILAKTKALKQIPNYRAWLHMGLSDMLANFLWRDMAYVAMSLLVVGVVLGTSVATQMDNDVIVVSELVI